MLGISRFMAFSALVPRFYKIKLSVENLMMFKGALKCYVAYSFLHRKLHNLSKAGCRIQQNFKLEISTFLFHFALYRLTFHNSTKCYITSERSL